MIIPAYNAERYVADAIKSVQQQSPPTRIIVVNDGSTDNTAEVLKSIQGITVIHQENQGIGQTLNNGLQYADTDLISFLDADDLWCENKLMLQMQVFEKMNFSGIVFGQIEQFFSEDIEESVKVRLEEPQRILPGVHRSTMLTDKETLRRVGDFSVDYVSEEFLDWYLRAKEHAVPIQIIDHILARRRIHGNNITLGVERKEANKFPLIIKQALERRRQKN